MDLADPPGLDDRSGTMLKRLRGDRRGQMFILEVITSGLLIVAAISFITTLPAPSQDSTLYLHQWGMNGEDVFRALDNLPSVGYASKLDEAMCHDLSILIDKLNESLSQTLSFNLYLRNESVEITLYYSDIPDPGNSARENYIAYFTGGDGPSFYCRDISSPETPEWKEMNSGLYEISIVLWYEARGLIG